MLTDQLTRQDIIDAMKHAKVDNTRYKYMLDPTRHYHVYPFELKATEVIMRVLEDRLAVTPE